MREPNCNAGLVLCLVHLLVLFVNLTSSTALEVHLWPQPQLVEWGTGPPIPLSDTFYINATAANDVLQYAGERYRDLLHRERWLPIDLFSDDFYHGGGDEVAPGCWNNSTDIKVGVLAGHCTTF